MRLSLISAALVAALVGYGSTIALVLSAAAAVGATRGQTASWVLALCLTKAAGSALLSSWKRVPVVLAWSTPGAALVAASQGLNMAQAVGAFVLAGALVVLTAALGPLGRAVNAIPDGVAGGMLAGILLPFCLAGVAAADVLPALVLPMVAVFLLVRQVNPAMAVLAALATGLALSFLTGAAALPYIRLPLPLPEFVAPEWNLGALVGLGVPLYLVTMASQNLPGFATMRAAGYTPPVRPALGVTGVLSMLGGLFCGHTISMAAITAAICLGPDVHPDRDRRWLVGPVYAAVWVGLGLLGPAILAFLDALPPGVMEALVALALLGPLTGALSTGFAVPDQRFAATATLVVTASGVAVLGVGAAFWGLVAGVTVYLAEHRMRRPVVASPAGK